MTNKDAQVIPYSDLLLNANEIDRDAVFSRLNTLNMLHHLHLNEMVGSDGIRKGPSLFHRQPGKTGNGNLIGSLETSIDIAEHFHSFLVENRMALDEVKSNVNALVFGRIADMTGMLEEYITKEDPLKDILMQMVPFLLSTFPKNPISPAPRSVTRGSCGPIRSTSIPRSIRISKIRRR